MLIEKRIARAEKRAVKAFDKKNEIKEEAEYSAKWVYDLDCESFNDFLDDELNQLEKANRRYEKRMTKLEKLRNFTRLEVAK